MRSLAVCLERRHWLHPIDGLRQSGCAGSFQAGGGSAPCELDEVDPIWVTAVRIDASRTGWVGCRRDGSRVGAPPRALVRDWAGLRVGGADVVGEKPQLHADPGLVVAAAGLQLDEGEPGAVGA